LRLSERLTEGTVAANRTVPEKPLTLVTLNVEVAVCPGLILRLLAATVITKSGVVLVENVAVWTVSGTGVGVPFVTVTQTPPVTLVPAQPV
jgi:hypothetical protein